MQTLLQHVDGLPEGYSNDGSLSFGCVPSHTWQDRSGGDVDGPFYGLISGASAAPVCGVQFYPPAVEDEKENTKMNHSGSTEVQGSTGEGEGEGGKADAVPSSSCASSTKKKLRARWCSIQWNTVDDGDEDEDEDKPTISVDGAAMASAKDSR